MHEILKFIPGFRSSVKWKMIVAGIYYLLALTSLTSSLGIFLFIISIPFMIFYGINAIKIRKKNSIMLFIIAFIVLCSGIKLMPNTSGNGIKAITSAKTEKKLVVKKQAVVITKAASNKAIGELKIHYIDVGQGDSQLIQNNGQNMLIDTGTNESTSSLISYLQSQNIKKIDYLVLTHPHEDHIGGADAVIKTFSIGTVYMPQITTNTKTFKDVVLAMQSKGLKAIQPALGTTFKVGDSNNVVYGPVNSNSKDLNTYSIVIKLTFGNNKFIFTGDAQASNEEGMINNGYDLSADVLKVGHHGSHTSTSQEFLDKVNPKYAVISCGKSNDYGHPHAETMERFQKKGVQVYRTDESGTIVCITDGNTISFNSKQGDYSSGKSGKVSENKNNPSQEKTTAQKVAPAAPGALPETQSTNKEVMVYVTLTGKKYHLVGCKTIKKSSTVIPLSQAKAEGYTPCKVCNPPQ